MYLLTIVFLLILILGVSTYAVLKEVIIESLEMLEGDEIVKIDIQLEKIGPTKFLVNGTLKHFKQFDDNWNVRLEITHTSKTVNEPNFMYYPSEKGEGFCEFLQKEYEMFFYETLKYYSNVPHYETCPLEPNEYIIRNYPFDSRFFVDFIIQGNYEVVIVAKQLQDLVKYKLNFSV